MKKGIVFTFKNFSECFDFVKKIKTSEKRCFVKLTEGQCVLTVNYK